MTAQLASPERTATVTLSSGEFGVRLRLAFGGEFTGGEMVLFPDAPGIGMEPADELSATYTLKNWASGIMSGALYAFRSLRIPRQRLLVREFTGRLRASDMEAVAHASAVAVATLADREMTISPPDGWSVSQPDITFDRNSSEAKSAGHTSELRSAG